MTETRHRRRQIFEAIEATLAAIDGFSASDKVKLGRTKPVREEALPAFSVTWATEPETAEHRPHTGANGGLGYKRRVNAAIFVHLKSVDPLGQFDELSIKVEAAMAADTTLGGLALDCTLDQTQFFTDSDTGLPLGLGRIDYAIDYTADAANPVLGAL
ncbi:MAG: hypothetical protein AAGG72_10520 [Pseudomonadota bacterium]